MVEALERNTPWNRGSSYFKGDWLVEPDIDDVTIGATTTLQVNLDDFANAAFVYLIEVDTDSTDWELKIWNNAARDGAPALHLVKMAPLVNYRRLLLHVDEDHEAKLHYDLINNMVAPKSFSLTVKAVRQI